MTDKRGFLIEIGMEISVPDPKENDMYRNSFKGVVIDLLESRGTAIVEDQCQDVFEVETDRLEVSE
jgi:hypothetical protein